MMSCHPALLLVLGLGLVSSQSLSRQTCDSTKTQATIQSNADAVIGGVLSMHDQGSGGFGCGTVTADMQPYEATRWVLELLNKKNQTLNGEWLTDTYVPGIRLGMTVRDYCSRREGAVFASEEFFPQFSSDSRSCTQSSSGLTLGIIGTSDSDSSKDVAKFAEPFNIPVVSYMATAPELSNSVNYPSFMRTIPPDGPLMDVIVAAIKQINWDYLSVVYTDNSHGRQSYEEIRPRLFNAGICLTAAISTSPTATDNTAIDNVLDRLKLTQTVGVIYFGTPGVAYALLDRSNTNPHRADMTKLQWIFTDSVSLTKNFGVNTYPRGILSIVPTSRYIVEFEDHWVRINENNPSPENPWFKEWFAEQNQCSFLGDVINPNPAYQNIDCATKIKTESEKRQSFIQDRFVEPAVHAVFSYAIALRSAQADMCTGLSANTACAALRSMTSETFLKDYLMKVNFTYSTFERVPSLASPQYAPYFSAAKVRFDDNGDIVDPAYDIWNLNDAPTGGDSDGFKFRRVGSWINGRLSLNLPQVRMYDTDRITSLNPLPASPCPTSGCSPCLGITPTTKYLYIPGDIVINGVFSIHGNGPTSLSCGDMKVNSPAGIQYLEAMAYALREVPRRFQALGGFLQGVSLGGLGIDDCMNGALSRNFISEVQRGVRDITDTNGNVLDPRTVDAYVAAQTSGLTIPLAELMNDLERPLVGYSSSSTALSDRQRYPFYLRVHPGAEEEMLAVVNVLKRLDWFYVQTVHVIGDADSVNRNQVFRRLAAEHGICVVADHSFDDMVVEKIRNRPSVKPVVVIGQTNDYRAFLEHVTNANASGDFAIIAITPFGTRQRLVEGLESADGVISLKWRTPDMSFFRTYLNSLRTASNLQNPWFVEWFEEMYDCYIGSTNPNSKPTICANPNLPITDATDFELTEESFFVMNSVYAIANGLHVTLNEYCGLGYSGICGNFTSSGTRGSRLLENTRASRFRIEGSNPPEDFSFNGYQGNLMIDVFNYQRNRFVKVGDFNPASSRYTDSPANSIQLYSGSQPSAYTPSCPGFCVQCLYVFQAMKYQYIPGDIIIPAIFDVHRGGMSSFACGRMRTSNGFQYTEAFAYALNTINEGNMFDNVRIGGLLLDGCSSSSRATALLNNLHSGVLMLHDDNSMNIQTKNFMSWMTYDSKSTIDVSDILAMIGIPNVSPAATAPLLDDKQRFSTFFRTIRSDMNIARGMATLVKELGFSHVITLNAPDFSSRETRDEFRRLAEDDGICLLASYEFVTDGNMDLIVRSINESTTQVVMVFAEPDEYVPELLRKHRQMYPGNTIIYIANRQWNLPSDVRTAPLNSITFNFYSPTVQTFSDYLATKRPTADNPNPWFREYYEERYSCNLPGSFRYGTDCSSNYRAVTDADFVQDLWVLSSVNAVYAIAEGIKRTLEEKCGNVPGVCSAFRTSNDKYERIMANMDVMNFTDVVSEAFRFVEREADREYRIKQFISDGSQIEVGTYNDTLSISRPDLENLRSKFNGVKSTCDAECLACRGSATNFDEFTYTSGNFYFVGLFDVHRKGATPFTCGDINTKHGFELLEAFHYAIDYVNSKQGIFADILQGVEIGAVGLDVCMSPTRAGNLVANIHSGNINLRKGDLTVNPRNFDVYIGTFETKASIRVADVLSSLSIPQISYGATSLELRDEKKHRYFLRTVPADDKQARAIISYLKRFNIDNVQVVSSFDSVGEKGKEEFQRLAFLNRICVSHNLTVGENGPFVHSEAVQTLAKIADNDAARVVVLFMDNPQPLLLAAEDDENIRGKFFFIGTDKWGMDLDMLSGLDQLIRNRKAVTLDVETADLPGFDQYLEDKVPNNYKTNPWFEDFFQTVHGCYIDTPTSEISRPCTASDLGIPRAEGYIQDPYVLYVVNAVFSAALGLHHAIEEVCGTDYSYVCTLFKTSGERRQRIFRNIKAKAQFEDATRQPFYFTPGGESDRGYHIYEPVANPLGTPRYVYKNVGSYNDTDYLKLDIRYDIDVQSRCDQPGARCNCTFPVFEPSRYMLKEDKYDLNLIYVGNIHDSNPREPFQCGQINTDSNFQRMMAFFYAIESVNNNTNRRFPASLKFGGLALDTCSRPYRLGQDVYSLLSGEGFCGTGQLGQVISPSTIVTVIADGTSAALPISSMLSPLKITTLSPSATSVELSSKQFHPYFLRTVPPDNVQAIVMLQIMKDFNWDYATVVYTNIPYGIAAKNTLLEQANFPDSMACISALERMEVDATMTDAEIIVDNLSQQVGSKVIILFTTRENSRLLLQATRSKGLTNRFIWLASDFWANSQDIVEGYEEEASGAITIQIRSEEVSTFVEYMKSLTLKNRRGIPDDWFVEFYQVIHQCRLLSVSTIQQKEFSTSCTENEVITDGMIPMDPFVLHTIISVYITAFGINNFEECRSQPQLDISACLALQDERRRDLIYNGILNSQWNVMPNTLGNGSFIFKFTDQGYGDVGYNVLNYHRDTSQEQYVYTQIGTYQDVLTLDRSRYTGSGILESGVLPISQCPAGITCTCLNPDGRTTRSYVRQSATSADIDAIYVSREDGNYYNSLTGEMVKASKVPSIMDRFTDIWAIIVGTIAAVGCFISMCMFIYLLVVYPNRGGTSILGFTLTFGIILLYALVFAFIAHANNEICGLRRFGLGLIYALCYGSLFVKLIDCWRTQDKSDMDDVKYNKLGRPLGLFFVVFLLVLVQVIINSEWLILQPPDTVHIYYQDSLWPRCNPNDYYDEGLVLSLVYVMALILLSVIFGFATFSKSKNHYESRWILGIAVLSIPCWVIWCLVATIGVYKVRDAAVAIGLLINATFMLLLGPLRKLYLLNKYQAMIEEEEKEYAASHRGPDYASTYGRQYDNVPHMHEGSIHGSTMGRSYGRPYNNAYARQYAPSSHNGTTRSTGSAYNPYSDPRSSSSSYPDNRGAYPDHIPDREETELQ